MALFGIRVLADITGVLIIRNIWTQTLAGRIPVKTEAEMVMCPQAQKDQRLTVATRIWESWDPFSLQPQEDQSYRYLDLGLPGPRL